MIIRIINQSLLKKHLSYNKNTGVFKWKTTRENAIKIGTEAGGFDKNGYKVISFFGRKYKAHRLAWLYVTGRMPKAQIDHINGKHSDNRFINLREAKGSINQENKRIPRVDNALGILGVSIRHGKYLAQIQVYGKKYWIGLFKSPEEASSAYMKAKRKLHKGCTL